jgi:hypothetical protein
MGMVEEFEPGVSAIPGSSFLLLHVPLCKRNFVRFRVIHTPAPESRFVTFVTLEGLGGHTAERDRMP